MTSMNTELKTRSGADRYALHGLSLPRSVLNALDKRGVYCQPAVSLEHQHLANRYVLRGVESGGAVTDIGRASAANAPEGGAVFTLTLPAGPASGSGWPDDSGLARAPEPAAQRNE